MLEFRVAVDQSKDSVDYLVAIGSCVTAVAAVVTVFVARLISRNQNSLQTALAAREQQFRQAQLDQQERQLRKDLFDRRFEVYLGVRDFMRYVSASPDDIRPTGAEFTSFRDQTEKSEMLFGDDVYQYMLKVGKMAGDLHVINSRRRAHPGNVELIDQSGELFNEFSTTVWAQRQVIFKIYLQLG